MNKIFTIIQREFSTRIRNKSFIIACIIGPLFFSFMMLIPNITMQMESDKVDIIAVVDSTHAFRGHLPETDYIKFVYMPDANITKYKAEFTQSGYDAILFISHVVVNSDKAVFLYSDKPTKNSVKMHIANSIEKRLETEKLRARGINYDILASVKTNISINSVIITPDGLEKRDNTELKYFLSMIMAFVMYLCIYASGNMVMHGVVEEKTNRIIEIIITSVKPMQLMMGKILGVGLVALMQFTIWILLTTAIYSTITNTILPDTTTITQTAQTSTLLTTSGSQMQQSQAINEETIDQIKETLINLNGINFVVIILSFLFFFIGGYFLYAAMFAAIGAMVDSQSDTQSYVTIISAPALITLIAITLTIVNPNSALLTWLSFIPFTAPIAMVARIPYGVSYTEFFLSAIVLIITFVVVTWLAGKIYKTGILMYGKKATLKDICKWFKQ